MKTALFLLLATLSVPAVPAAPAGPSAVPPRLFAPLGMTKQQVNAPAPAISGVFLHIAGTDWTHFGGDQIKWVNAIAVDPVDPDVIYLGCGNGILRSRDNGRTWRMTTGWHVADVQSLQVDPAHPATVYAATGWGIWRSTDGGDTWAESDRGLPWKGKYSQSLVLDFANPARLIVGTTLGLCVSTDGADSWAAIAGAPATPILHVEQSSADPRLWLAGTRGEGVLLSTDNGVTWHSAAPALAHADVYAAATDPTAAARLAAAGWNEGVWISTDGGKDWTDRTHGLPSPHVSALAFDPTHPGRLWASTFEEGTFYSDDLGATWRPGGIYGAYVNQLCFLPAPR